MTGQWVYGQLTSMSLAVTVLTLLMVGVMLGVFIPQESLVDGYQIRDQFGAWYWPMRAAGLFTVFSAPWFIALEALLLFSVCFGSFIWLKPAWNQAVKPIWIPAQSILNKAVLPVLGFAQPEAQTAATVSAVLRKAGYKIQTQLDATTGRWVAYATRGSWGRLGPHISHVGIVATILASFYGALTGFKAQHLIKPGESFTLPQAERLFYNASESLWVGHVPAWKITVKDFWIDYYANSPDTPKNYYSTLSVETGDEVSLPLADKVSGTISVNHPLNLPGDVTIYQASYQPTGNLWVTLNGKKHLLKPSTELVAPFADRPVATLRLPDQRATLIVFPFLANQDPGVTRSYVRVFVHRDGRGFVGAQPGKMPHNLKLHEGQGGQILGLDVQFVAPEMMTGLQIKRAPETLWIYLAFLILSIGVAVSFRAQRQLWATLTPDEADPATTRLHLFAKTNKAHHAFQQELSQLYTQLAAASTTPVTRKP